MNSLVVVTETETRLAQFAKDAAGAYATATERAFKADTAIFTAWCSAAGLASLPADPATVAKFIDTMGETKAPATVRRYVSSVSTYHRAAGAQNPVDAETVKLALKRLHRAKGRAQKQAKALARCEIDRMLAAAPNTLMGLRNRALLAVAYDTLCRRSELAALQVADIEATAQGSATVTIRRSKTDQEGEGMIRFLAADTMRHVSAWRLAAGVTEGALFRAINKGGRVGDAIPAGELPRLFKGMAIAAGMSTDAVAAISGHSTRVGAAVDMVTYGIGLPDVMQAGGWKSATMVSRYTRKQDAATGGAAKLAMMQNRD